MPISTARASSHNVEKILGKVKSLIIPESTNKAISKFADSVMKIAEPNKQIGTSIKKKR